MSAERIDLLAITPQAWKNGTGLTREIAFGGARSAGFDWRISLAEVARNAPFSAFPGIDRCIVLLRGAGMRLRSGDGAIDHALTTPLTPFAFPGDAALDATLVAGPCSDFNVMTRRGVFRSELRCEHSASSVESGDVTLLLCASGTWQIAGDDDFTLAPMHALLWRTPTAPLRIQPLDGAGALLVVRLCHDRQP